MIEELHIKLKEFSDKYEIKQEAMKSCLKAMTNCINDDPNGLRGFSIDEIRLEFAAQELIFEHYLYLIPFVKTRIELYKKIENRGESLPIGYYELDTDMKGYSFDDWLIINVEKNNEIEIVYDLEILSDLLPQNYLKRNSIYYEYISYLAHVATLYQSKKYRACQFFIKRAFEFILDAEIKNDFQKYVKESKKYMKRIASYMHECGLIDNDLLERFKELEVLKPKVDKL